MALLFIIIIYYVEACLPAGVCPSCHLTEMKQINHKEISFGSDGYKGAVAISKRKQIHYNRGIISVYFSKVMCCKIRLVLSEVNDLFT